MAVRRKGGAGPLRTWSAVQLLRGRCLIPWANCEYPPRHPVARPGGRGAAGRRRPAGGRPGQTRAHGRHPGGETIAAADKLGDLAGVRVIPAPSMSRLQAVLGRRGDRRSSAGDPRLSTCCTCTACGTHCCSRALGPLTQPRSPSHTSSPRTGCWTRGAWPRAGGKSGSHWPSAGGRCSTGPRPFTGSTPTSKNWPRRLDLTRPGRRHPQRRQPRRVRPAAGPVAVSPPTARARRSAVYPVPQPAAL